MPAASSKTELLSVTKREFARLTRLLDTIDAETAVTRPAPGEPTIKDIIGHRAHWIALFFGWVERGRAGEPVQTPADGVKWNELKAYNTALRTEQSGLSWVDARQMLADQHERLMRFLGDETDEALYTRHLADWMNAWPLGRWAEASGASHYRSATKYIRACLRALEDQASSERVPNSAAR